MLPDRVSNPGPLIYESGALPIALRGPASLDAIGAVCHQFGLLGTDLHLIPTVFYHRAKVIGPYPYLQ